jgi:hypothetical protein
MVTTPVQRRTSLIMLLKGAVGGAVEGWFAHRAIVANGGGVVGVAEGWLDHSDECRKVKSTERHGAA